MKLERIKQVTREAADSGSLRLDDARDARRRRQLRIELGNLVHRQHRGDEVPANEINAILAELDDLDAGAAPDQRSYPETSMTPPQESEPGS